MIEKETGDIRQEAYCHGNLGRVFGSVSDFVKAEESIRKALAIRKEIGDKCGEAADYANLATVSGSLGKYAKAKEYLEKALSIRKEIGDKSGEASCYANLGTVYRSVSEYVKAEDYLQKALTIGKEIGDRNGIALCYGVLMFQCFSVLQFSVSVFQCLDEYGKTGVFPESTCDQQRNRVQKRRSRTLRKSVICVSIC